MLPMHTYALAACIIWLTLLGQREGAQLGLISWTLQPEAGGCRPGHVSMS